MKNNNNNQAGFTLIEVLAVLFIVSIAMLGLVSLIIQNIQAQSVNKNNLIAYNLAQEGIELIRQTRDANWRAGNGTLFDKDLANGKYYIDYRASKPTQTGDGLIYLYNGYYINLTGTESGAVPTIFTREIYLDKPVFEGDPLEVRALVTWNDRNHPYRYELRTLLFDWR
ncbi:MAG: prepilin-type N-terminal cleavage/methylation domain-containing protein [Patescibacteria group bacterium]